MHDFHPAPVIAEKCNRLSVQVPPKQTLGGTCVDNEWLGGAAQICSLSTS